MKSIRFILLIFIVVMTSSCASLTGRMDVVERDEFLYKLPMLNEQILGSLKYDDPYLDLRTLPVHDYMDSFEQIELTNDDKKTIAFLEKHISEQRYILRQNTFLVCLRSEARQFILCDDAATPGGDRIVSKEPVPEFAVFIESFLKDIQ